MPTLADGLYEAVIEDVNLRRAPGTFTNVLTWRLALKGETARVSRTLCITENTLSWLKDDLDKCGVVLGRLSELPGRLHEMHGRTVLVEKTTREGTERFFFRCARTAS